MAVFSNTMKITNSSLSSISKELINKRTYKAGSINIVGHPTILNGIASDISDLSYFSQTNIHFQESYNGFKIYFEGTLNSIEDGAEYCAWKLSDSSKSLYLYFTKNSVFLSTETGRVISLTGLNNSSASVKCIIEVTEDSCTLTAIVKQTIHEKTIQLENFFESADYTSLILGTNGKSNNKYFNGKIDLNSFIIYQKEDVIYAPSVGNSFTFTKLLVSDGEYPLTDNSTPVLNHIFTFNVH